MAIKSLTGISLVLRYAKGSLTYSSLKPSAADENIYEMGDAINSLQTEAPKSINKIAIYSILAG